MAAPTVLIGGAGIAGPSLAFWLTQSGYRVIVAELTDGIRPGGQTVDLRGAGGDVVGRMGLIDRMRERSLDQNGVAWIKADGSRRAEMPVTAFNGNGLVSKLEILRGDLVDVLYQATKDSADYRFNTRIEELNQADDAVEARLTDGTTLSADLVVGADGPHSAVRRLAFGPEDQFVQPLGGYNAWFTAPDSVGLDGWYLMYQAPGLNASMRPSHDPTLCKAGLAFRSQPVAFDRREPEQQRALLAKHSRAQAGSATLYWRRRPKPMTSTWTRSRRCTCRRFRMAAWSSSATPATALRPSAAWAPVWHSLAPTSLRASSVLLIGLTPNGSRRRCCATRR
jgi:2-polyprenyl-6-methoxyphenol hydroxylase-like FAD-dependent oxidoreductase